MRSALAITLMISVDIASADGRLFSHGRYPNGRTTVLPLTHPQKQVIDLYAKCRDQDKSPFVFHLTAEQSRQLRKEAGVSPVRFQIYDSYRGDKGAEDGYNFIVRFAEDRFEIPHEKLIPEKELVDWEVNVIGWQPSPLAKASATQLMSGTCPEVTPNPSVEARPNGKAPGPAPGVVYHPSAGPGASPSVPPHLER